MSVIIVFVLILLIFKHLKYIKELLLPTRKGAIDISVVIIGVCILSWLTYRYANTFINYIIGILGIILLVTTWLKEGITSKGFSSLYKYKRFISWEEIENIDVHKTNSVKITLFGKFMEQSFKFKNKDYDKLMDILKENLYKTKS